MPKKKKQIKKQVVIFGILSIIGIIYFAATFVKYTFDIQKLKQEEKNLNIQLDNLKHESENLKTEIEKLKDPEYITRYAREEYSYSKEKGEYVIKIEDDEPEIVNKETIEENNNYMYVIIGSGVLLLGIIIYIIKK